MSCCSERVRATVVESESVVSIKPMTLAYSDASEAPTAEWVGEQWQKSWRGLQETLEKHRQDQERLLQLALSGVVKADRRQTDVRTTAQEKEVGASFNAQAASPAGASTVPVASLEPGLDVGAAPLAGGGTRSGVAPVGAAMGEGLPPQAGPVGGGSAATAGDSPAEAQDEGAPYYSSRGDSRPWLAQEMCLELSERMREIQSDVRRCETGMTVLQRGETIFIRSMQWCLGIQEPPRNGRLARFIVSGFWQSAIAIVIAANALLMIAATDARLDATLKGGDLPVLILILEAAFVAFFLLEVVLRIIVHGRYFFCNDDWRWNWFDLFLVLQSFAEVIIDNLLDSTGPNLSFLRTLRALRFVRTFRAVRVLQFAGNLRRMIVSVMNSFSSLFWCFMMLLFIFYIFGLMVMQFVMGSEDLEGLDEEGRQETVAYFGSVAHTMLSIYMASTGGNDWGQYYEVLASLSWQAAMLWLFAMAYMQIAMLNILTGMFVETALKAAMPERDALALDQRREEFKQSRELLELMQQLDTDISGKISREEFRQITKNRTMHSAFDVMGLSIRDADLFFEMLCKTCQVDEVDRDFLVEACMKMKGTASSIELQMLAYRLITMNDKLERVLAVVDAHDNA